MNDRYRKVDEYRVNARLRKPAAERYQQQRYRDLHYAHEKSRERHRTHYCVNYRLGLALCVERRQVGELQKYLRQKYRDEVRQNVHCEHRREVAEEPRVVVYWHIHIHHRFVVKAAEAAQRSHERKNEQPHKAEEPDYDLSNQK